jgi:uncharacterized protein YkwD
VTFRRPLAAAALAAAPLAALPAGAPAAVRGHDRLEVAVVREINAVRAREGLRPLRLSGRLARVAERHSSDQLRRDRLTHTSGDGTSAATRVRRATRARGVGETVAFLPSPAGARAAAIVGLWLDSPAHRAALLTRGYRRIGVGRREGALGATAGTIVTANLATRR